MPADCKYKVDCGDKGRDYTMTSPLQKVKKPTVAKPKAAGEKKVAKPKCEYLC